MLCVVSSHYLLISWLPAIQQCYKCTLIAEAKTHLPLPHQRSCKKKKDKSLKWNWVWAPKKFPPAQQNVQHLVRCGRQPNYSVPSRTESCIMPTIVVDWWLEPTAAHSPRLLSLVSLWLSAGCFLFRVLRRFYLNFQLFTTYVHPRRKTHQTKSQTKNRNILWHTLKQNQMIHVRQTRWMD